MSLDSFYAEYAEAPAVRALPTTQGEAADPQHPFRAWSEAHPDD